MSLVVPFKEIFQNEVGLLSKHQTWERVELGEVCDVLNGYAFKSTLFNKTDGFPIIRIRDLARSSTETFYKGDYPKEYVVDKGDLLIGMDGNFGCYEWKGDKALLNQRVCKLIPNEETFNGKFLLFSINGYLKAIQDATSSVTVGHLSSRDIQKIPLPFPPLNAQKRIVEKLEKLLGKVEAVQARLDKIPAILKRFRQAVLAAACSGKLTADWRLENQDVKSANQLLNEIAEQRKIDYTKAVENAKQLGLKKPRKILAETVPDVELNVVDLPSTWTMTDVNFLAHVTKLAGFEYTKYFDVKDEGEIPLIRAQNVQMGRFVDENIKFISKEVSDILERSQLFGREILMVFIGAGTGNVCLAPNDRRWHLAPNVAKIDVHGTDTNYLLLYLQSSVGLESTFSFIKATAQPSLSMETIRQIVVCLPPLEEQKEIVRRVEDLFKFADQIEARYKKARSYTDKLTQSILAKAFRGELVPQDENDEPAAILLERIKAERSGYNSTKSKPKQKAVNQSKLFE